MHGGLFKYLHACVFCGARKTKDKVQRMQMRGTHVQNATLVIGGRADRLQLVMVQRLDLVIAIARLQMFCIVVQMAHLTGRRPGPSHPGLEVTLNLMFGDQAFDQRFGLFAHAPQFGGMIGPKHLFQTVLFDALATAQLAAIAPRCAKTYALCLDQNHAASGLGQMKCG